MKVVSHRGNLSGPSDEKENSPNQIDLAINKGYLVEIDLRVVNDEYLLGHDEGKFKISYSWLMERASKLVIHAKDLDTCDILSSNLDDLNWFYHTDEDVVQTSKGWLWAYPGIYLKNAITVILDKDQIFPENIRGVCTDYPDLIKFKLDLI